jgi:hypothetical protein
MLHTGKHTGKPDRSLLPPSPHDDDLEAFAPLPSGGFRFAVALLILMLVTLLLIVRA